jgi:hypothetical protein
MINKQQQQTTTTIFFWQPTNNQLDRKTAFESRVCSSDVFVPTLHVHTDQINVAMRG